MKRLIVCSDGLWRNTTPNPHSNVALLASAILPTATANGGPVVQLCFADGLPGAAGSMAEMQPSLAMSTCSLYRNLALNYQPGDQLWFFGFSRGSTVARHCIGLLRNVGLLKKQHLDKLAEAWRIYTTSWNADASNALGFRSQFSHITPVKFLGAWETVGTLGVPEGNGETLAFHDNKLSGCVENACHALAIDENNKQLMPSVWRTPPDRTRTEQCWFRGNHREIGGMGGDMQLANISLGWIAERAASLGLGLDSHYLATAMTARLGDTNNNSAKNATKNNARCRFIGVHNGDETLHSSAEQHYLRTPDYKPQNLKLFLGRDEQIQLPL